jgi:hypothetical protein
MTGSAGKSGTGTGGVSAAPPCDAVGTVFQAKCATGCHSPNGIWPALDLSSDVAASKAVGAAQTASCTADRTSSIVNPKAPLGGSLFLYVGGSTCGSGTRMPYGGSALSTAEIACIRSYYMSKLH